MPSKFTLIYLSVIDVIFLVSTLLLTYQSVTRIYDSSHDKHFIPHNPSKKLFKAVLLVDTAAVIFPLNSLISHLSGIYTIITDRSPAYLFIGFRSLIHPIGFIFYIVGMVMLFQALVVYNPFKNLLVEKTLTRVLIVTILLLLFIPGYMFISNEFGLITQFTQYFIVLLALMLIFLIVYLYRVQRHVNQIVKLRMLLLVTMLMLFLSLIVVIWLYFPSTGEREYYPTRYAVVEFLIFSFNIFGLTTGTLLYLFISLPLPLREIFGIERLDLYQDREDDLDLETFQPWVHSIQLTRKTMQQISREQKNDYVIVECFDSNTKGTKALISNIQDIFETTKIMSTNIMTEDYFSTYEIHHTDLVIVGNSIDEILRTTLFDRMKAEYQNTTFRFDDEVLQVDKFRYEMENTEFALLVAIESFWSTDHKIWILLLPKKLSENMIHFVHNYQNYFDQISNVSDVFAVLRFQVQEGEILAMPQSVENLSEPDSSFVIYLGVSRG